MESVADGEALARMLRLLHFVGKGDRIVLERDGAAFAVYQVDRKLFSKAASDAVFLHCLPAHRGLEVSADVIDSPRSMVYDQAENRLHVQKAILHTLLN